MPGLWNQTVIKSRSHKGSGVRTGMHFIVQGVAENPVFIFSADDPNAIETAVLNVNREFEKRHDGRAWQILLEMSSTYFPNLVA
jgi:hypothetical protein